MLGSVSKAMRTVDEGHMVMRFLVVSQFTDTSKDMLSGTARLLLPGRGRE
jgi:hypothetical protein